MDGEDAENARRGFGSKVVMSVVASDGGLLLNPHDAVKSVTVQKATAQRAVVQSSIIDPMNLRIVTPLENTGNALT